MKRKRSSEKASTAPALKLVHEIKICDLMPHVKSTKRWEASGVLVQDGMAAGAWRSITEANRTDITATGEIRADFLTQWIEKNYTVENNPGRGDAGYYLYLRMLSTVLDRMGMTSITDGKGNAHDWRAEVTACTSCHSRDNGGAGLGGRADIEEP